MDVIKYKQFRVGDLFDIHPTKTYKGNNSDLFDDNGKNPVLGNTSTNNGIGGYSSKPCTENGGIITFSDTTTADAIQIRLLDIVMCKGCILIQINGQKNPYCTS